jgi:phage-related protein
VKPIAFLGGSLDDLRGFPADARREAGYQLDRVQRGLDPDDWRPMPSMARAFARSGFAKLPVPLG